MDMDSLRTIQEHFYLASCVRPSDPRAWALLESSLTPLQHVSRGGTVNYRCVKDRLQEILESGVAEVLIDIRDFPKTSLSASCAEMAEHVLTLVFDVIEASQRASSSAALSLERCSSPTGKCR